MLRYLKKRVVPQWFFIFLCALALLGLGYFANAMTVSASQSNATGSPVGPKKPNVQVTITVKPKVKKLNGTVHRYHRYRPARPLSTTGAKTKILNQPQLSDRQITRSQLNQAVGNPPLPPIQHLMSNGHWPQPKTIICPPRINKIRPPVPPPTIIKTESGEIKIPY